jgi:hypothetical protein
LKVTGIQQNYIRGQCKTTTWHHSAPIVEIERELLDDDVRTSNNPAMHHPL